MKRTFISFVLILFVAHFLPLQSGIWKDIGRPELYYQEIQNIACFDDTTCLVVSSHYKNAACVVHKTIDGGNTWKLVFADTSGPYRKWGITHFSPNLSYLRGDPISKAGGPDFPWTLGQIQRSTDAGETWEEIEKVPYDSLYSYVMSNDSAGYKYMTYRPDLNIEQAFKYYKVKYTTDGWKTWKWLELPDKYKYENSGFYLGETKIINSDFAIMEFEAYEDTSLASPSKRVWVHAEDSMKNWTEYQGPDSVYMYFILDERHIWATSYKSNSAIYFSGDTARTWKIIYERENVEDHGQLYQVTFTDANNGIAIGNYYTVHRTIDGGRTWTNDTLDGYAGRNGKEFFGFWDVQFPSQNSAFAILTVPLNHIARYSPNYTINDVETILKRSDLVVYPNPLKRGESLHLLLNSEYSGEVEVYISNLLGHKLFNGRYIATEALGKTLELPLDLSGGLYILSIKYGIQREVLKIIVFE